MKTMECRYSLEQANGLLPLLRAIAREVVERRTERRELFRLREDLDNARTPEGLGTCLADLDARIFVHKTALRAALQEIEDLSLTVLRLSPMTVHIPGVTRQGPLTFCWQIDEPSVLHGHQVGEEEDPRRPLRVRARR
jgi:hypothetical protein